MKHLKVFYKSSIVYHVFAIKRVYNEAKIKYIKKHILVALGVTQSAGEF